MRNGIGRSARRCRSRFLPRYRFHCENLQSLPRLGRRCLRLTNLLQAVSPPVDKHGRNRRPSSGGPQYFHPGSRRSRLPLPGSAEAKTGHDPAPTAPCRSGNRLTCDGRGSHRRKSRPHLVPNRRQTGADLGRYSRGKAKSALWSRKPLFDIGERGP